MTEDIKEVLEQLLNEGKNWAKLATPVKGVHIVKMPAKGKLKAKLALEINPPLKGTEEPSKRKGLFITTQAQLEAFFEAFKERGLLELMGKVDEINEIDKYNSEPKTSNVVGTIDFPK